MRNLFLSAVAVALTVRAVAAQSRAPRADATVPAGIFAKKAGDKLATKKAAAADTIVLPEAHNGQVYFTRLVGAGAFHLPVTCTPDDRIPKWLTFDCNSQQFHGTADEPDDVQYTFTVSMQGSGDKLVSYVMQLPVRTGADIAVVHGAAPKLPEALLRDPAFANSRGAAARPAAGEAAVAGGPVAADSPAVVSASAPVPPKSGPLPAVPPTVTTKDVPPTAWVNADPPPTDGSKAAKQPLAVKQPNISSPLVEGATAISGTATPSQPPFGVISVALLRIEDSGAKDQSSPKDQAAAKDKEELSSCFFDDELTAPKHTSFLPFSSASGTSSTTIAVNNAGVFTATMAQGLAEGDRIRVVQVLPAGTEVVPGDERKCNSAPATVEYKFDWFRTNVTFAAGVLLSNSSTSGQSSANFSQANQFYSLNVDRSWRLPGADCVDGRPFGKLKDTGNAAIDPACKDRKDPQTSLNRWKASRVPGFSTYFETRLTSIPVSSTTTTTSVSTNTTSGTTTGTAPGASPVTAASPTAAATTTPAFLTSQKTIRVSTGAYLPWIAGHSDGHHPDAIFFAPIAKVGFDTIAGSAQQSTVILPNNQVGTLNYESAYNFFSFGGRVGHMQLSSSRGRAPAIDDYLDVTVGRFSNLGSFICHTVPHTGTSTTPSKGTFTNTSCLADYPNLYYSNGNSSGNAIADVSDSLKRLYRVDLEGLIKIPNPVSFPLYVGFNANIAQHTLGAAHLDHAYAPPDDIRIFFGTKFDIGSFLTRFDLGAK